jgi:hypothetical protein
MTRDRVVVEHPNGVKLAFAVSTKQYDRRGERGATAEPVPRDLSPFLSEFGVARAEAPVAPPP